jgi:hypothetical protein
LIPRSAAILFERRWPPPPQPQPRRPNLRRPSLVLAVRKTSRLSDLREAIFARSPPSFFLVGFCLGSLSAMRAAREIFSRGTTQEADCI